MSGAKSSTEPPITHVHLSSTLRFTNSSLPGAPRRPSASHQLPAPMQRPQDQNAGNFALRTKTWSEFDDPIVAKRVLYLYIVLSFKFYRIVFESFHPLPLHEFGTIWAAVGDPRSSNTSDYISWPSMKFSLSKTSRITNKNWAIPAPNDVERPATFQYPINRESQWSHHVFIASAQAQESGVTLSLPALVPVHIRQQAVLRKFQNCLGCPGSSKLAASERSMAVLLLGSGTASHETVDPTGLDCHWPKAPHWMRLQQRLTPLMPRHLVQKVVKICHQHSSTSFQWLFLLLTGATSIRKKPYKSFPAKNVSWMCRRKHRQRKGWYVHLARQRNCNSNKDNKADGNSNSNNNNNNHDHDYNH